MSFLYLFYLYFQGRCKTDHIQVILPSMFLFFNKPKTTPFPIQTPPPWETKCSWPTHNVIGSRRYKNENKKVVIIPKPSIGWEHGQSSSCSVAQWLRLNKTQSCILCIQVHGVSSYECVFSQAAAHLSNRGCLVFRKMSPLLVDL